MSDKQAGYVLWFPLVLLVTAWLLWLTASAKGATEQALAELPYVPDGVHIGMSLEKFRVVRPRAQSATAAMERFDQRGAEDKGATVTEKREREVFFESGVWEGKQSGTQTPKAGGKYTEANVGGRTIYLPAIPTSATSYQFRKDKCVSFAVELQIPWGDFVAERKDVVRKYVHALGKDFKRTAVRRVKPGWTHMAPALLWDTGDSQVVLAITPDFTEIECTTGEIYILVKDKVNDEPRGMFEEVPPERLERLFKCLKDSLPK
jgi:hypothetical protein